MKKLLIGFIIGFLIGPLVVVEGFGLYTEHKIALMDKQNVIREAFDPMLRKKPENPVRELLHPQQ